MNCPACSNELSEMKVEEITVDVCKGGCGGIWFDNFELEKIDEKHERAGETLLDIERNKDLNVDLKAKRDCPKCSDIKMMQHCFSVQQKVTIDECAGCGGVWLDAGELAQIRNLYDTEEQRHHAAEKYFSSIFDGQLKGIKEKSETGAVKAKKFANMFKFICPTYYIPGDQGWGAF